MILGLFASRLSKEIIFGRPKSHKSANGTYWSFSTISRPTLSNRPTTASKAVVSDRSFVTATQHMLKKLQNSLGLARQLSAMRWPTFFCASSKIVVAMSLGNVARSSTKQTKASLRGSNLGCWFKTK